MTYIPLDRTVRRVVIFFLPSVLVEIDEMPDGCLLLASSRNAYIYVRCSLLFSRLITLLSPYLFLCSVLTGCPSSESSSILPIKSIENNSHSRGSIFVVVRAKIPLEIKRLAVISKIESREIKHFRIYSPVGFD
jgi:hypothetical protein